MTIDEFIHLALSFPYTIAAPHFDRTAFRMEKKKIFATLHEESKTVNMKFSPVDQSVYSLINKEAIYPINNKWGLKGWTTFKLDAVDYQLMLDALDTAYKEALNTPVKKKKNT